MVNRLIKKLCNCMSSSDDELLDKDLKCQKFSLCGDVYKCKVVKCYDGDTIHCVFKFNRMYQRFVVRMLGYNSSEIRTKNKTEKEMAIKARNKLSELIMNKIVFIECGKFDKYGRLLGIIKLNKNDKTSINDIMLNEGFGVEYNP